jgi:capsular polysaccharide export protein
MNRRGHAGSGAEAGRAEDFGEFRGQRRVDCRDWPACKPANAVRVRDSGEGFRPQRPVAGGGVSALFPELAGNRRQPVLLAEGLLRAPPRGRTPPPCLSALAWEISSAGAPAGIVTPDQALADAAALNPALVARAAAARRGLVAARIGGAWWQAGGASELPTGDRLALVVLAEPPAPGNQSPPSDCVLAAMLDRALAENPADRVVVLGAGPMPEAIGRQLQSVAARGATIIGRALDPWLLLDRAARVYGAGGEIGFLALAAGVPVTAFGPAFYTGWGATEDSDCVPTRPLRRTVDEIFAGLCLVATRYRDPFRDTAASFEEIVAILADWRRAEEANRRIAVCVGMSFWKRRRIAEFLRSSEGVPKFRRTTAGALAAAHGGPATPRAIAGWASRLPDGLAEAAVRRGVPLIRVEDGFIRSVGLGSDFLPPASLVFDARGMYFDPRVRSDLEVLLSEAEFAPELVSRAGRLATQLVARGVTKYNLPGGGSIAMAPAGVRRILVPGQVEDDLSIVHGAGAVRTNLGLLAAVRSADPDAFILYKPHPDVMAGHRKGAVSEGEARRFADVIVPGGSTAALLAEVDELHTMTSLAGFEALLRGRRVVVYGRPFYAGWGLTADRPALDRGRRLTLEELVAGVLILYPRYLDPLTRLPCGPEVIIERLDHPELWRPGPLVLARRWQGGMARRLAALRALHSNARSQPGSGLGRGLKAWLRQ